MLKTKHKKYILLSLFASSLCLIYLLPYSVKGHDTMFHVLRLESIVTSIKNGIWFPKVFPDAYKGYGYSTSLFYSDFFLYIPVIFTLLGLDILVAYKLYNVIVIFATVFSAYYCLSKITYDENSAIIGAMVYAGSAYYAVDIVIRNALGESQAFVFLPFVLYGIYEVVLNDKDNIRPLIIGFSGLVLSHTLSLVLSSVFFAVFLILNIKRIIAEPERIISIVKSVIIVVFSTAFFLFPFAEQMLTEKFLSGYHARIWHPTNVTIRVRNLFWGANYTENPYFAPSLGIVMFIVFLACLYFFIRKASNNISLLSKFCFIGGCFSLIMATSLFPWWKFDPQLNIIQFPSRFHMYSTFFFAFSLALSISQYGKKGLDNILIIFIAAVCAVQFNFTVYQGFKAFRQDYIINRFVTDTSDFIWWDENYLHADHNREIWREEREEHIDTATGIRGDIEIDFSRDYSRRYIKFSNNTCDNSIEVAAIYYRGYTATDVNTGKKLPLTHSANGWIQVDIGNVPSGEFVVEYTGTFIQKISPVISIVFVLIMIIYHKKLKV